MSADPWFYFGWLAVAAVLIGLVGVVVIGVLMLRERRKAHREFLARRAKIEEGARLIRDDRKRFKL